MAKQTKTKTATLRSRISDTLLVEVAWEVCNQVGGIYTVIRSKAPSIIEKWGDRYCLVGPWFEHAAQNEFEPEENLSDPIGKAVKKMRDMGVDIKYGYWLVTGRPKVVLINPYSAFGQLGEIKYLLWEHHGISMGDHDPLLNEVVAFGHLVKVFFGYLCAGSKDVVAHFHEWMVGTAVPEMRRENQKASIVFTTHATLLGRYMAMNDAHFYDHLPFADWEFEAKKFNIEAQVKIERAAAHGSHVFTTVSEVTARECSQLLGRVPDQILPNGLNIQRFTALHEVQNLHQKFKEQINEFVMGHFFQSYSFDLDKTLYFFTSGRYEYRNKGFDITLEALARLNWMMQEAKINTTVVMFFITKAPYQSINPSVLHNRAMLGELKQTCEEIQKQVGEKLFYAAAAQSKDFKMPQLTDYVDDYWRLRYRRTLQTWKSHQLPPVVTHNLWHDDKDDILNFLRTANMVNNAHDKVKIVYHPDFIAPTNPLFGMEYGQFVRGCHLGVFPSYYEPWGYTPVECIARGVPTVTSDLSGFGDYVKKNMKEPESKGIYIVDRHNEYNQAAGELAQKLFDFVKLNRRERIDQRNKVEASSEKFDWNNLRKYYDRAYSMAFRSMK